jgi:hypothetical protein
LPEADDEDADETDDDAVVAARAADGTNGFGLAGHTVPFGGNAPRNR